MSLEITLSHNGIDYKAEVATIASTVLGEEHHGIWTAILHLEGDGWGQAAGDYCLDNKPDPRFGDRRVGTDFGLDHIMMITKTLGCSRWEQVKGQRCLVLRDGRGGGWSSVIKGIADMDGKRVLIFADHAKQWADLAEVSR